MPTAARAQASRNAARSRNIDELLGQTVPRRPSVPPPTKVSARPFFSIMKEWASQQVAAYRVGLVLGYLSMMYFGTSAYIAGIPTFDFTTPEGWTPIWSSVVVLGGLVGGIGSLKAGSEPETKEIKVFNGIELAGAIMLFVTLGTYAALLLVIGYGYGDPGRASIGAGFVALGIPATVRMLWLIFRPRFVAARNKLHTGPVILIPEGYQLVPIEPHGVDDRARLIHEQAPEADKGA